MALRWICLLSFCIASGCDDLLGESESTTRLILFASPRQLPADGDHAALIGVEVVKPGDTPPSGDKCVRLACQFGTLGDTVHSEVTTDAGLPCPSERCVLLTIPEGKLRRTFTAYRTTVDGQDILIGELFGSKCDAIGSAKLETTAFLTLQVPDQRLPPTDLGVPEPLDGSGGEVGDMAGDL